MIDIQAKEALIEGIVYNVGLNDGKQFPEIVFVGEGLCNKKPVLIFKSKEDKQVIINPSYQSYIEETDYDD